MGNGDGMFQPQVTYPVYGDWVGVADFNGDGKPDLAVAQDVSISNVDNFAILLGNGDGTFQPAITSGPSGNYNQTVLAVGDFNGDGKADIAIAACCDGNFVSILLGNGNGTFQPPVNSPTGQAPQSITIGDFNGDGKIDLAVANYEDDSVSILLGNGDGTFLPKVDYNVGTEPTTVIVSDFNGDGRQDLAVGNMYGTVNILLGNGDGTFQAPMPFNGGTLSLLQIATGDFNGDGIQDLAVASNYGTHNTLLFGNGDGTFQAPMAIPSCNAQSLAVGEFNGDGKADVAVSCTSPVGLMPPSTVAVFLGASSGVTAALTHAEIFTLGQTNAVYNVTVSNGLGSPRTSGAVTVSENLPTAGLTLVSMGGTGWSCPIPAPATPARAATRLRLAQATRRS